MDDAYYNFGRVVGTAHVFELASGRLIELKLLDQSDVYSGLIEGLPNRWLNARIVERLVKGARERYDDEPHVIPPKQTELKLTSRFLDEPPIALPAVACVARFRSLAPARDPDMDMSSLTIIWFQDEFALPLSEAAARAIHELDWGSLAHDGSFL